MYFLHVHRGRTGYYNSASRCGSVRAERKSSESGTWDRALSADSTRFHRVGSVTGAGSYRFGGRSMTSVRMKVYTESLSQSE